MDRISRLFIKAQETLMVIEYISCSFITPVDDHFELSAHIWDGKKESGLRVLKSEHPTEQEAIMHLDKLQDQYPGKSTQSNTILFIGEVG